MSIQPRDVNTEMLRRLRAADAQLARVELWARVEYATAAHREAAAMASDKRKELAELITFLLAEREQQQPGQVTGRLRELTGDDDA